MLKFFLLALGLTMAEQQPATSGTYISADEIATTLKQSIANNVVDQPIKATDVPGGKASLAMLRRVKAETSALIHDHVTEIYQIVEGAGTLIDRRVAHRSEADRFDSCERRHEPDRRAQRR